MRIDAPLAQGARITDPLVSQTREGVGERENDGDSDDTVKAATTAANRITP